MTTGEPGAYKIAFDEGRRTIDGQAQSLKEVRDRAGVMATTVAATAALAAGLVFRSGAGKVELGRWGVTFLIAAAIGFLVAMAAAIVVWWHRWLAYYTGRHARANQVRIERRLLWFAAGLIGLALETGGLIAMLVAKR